MMRWRRRALMAVAVAQTLAGASPAESQPGRGPPMSIPSAGRGFDAPGRGFDPPGRSFDPPGHGLDPPGRALDAPGRAVAEAHRAAAAAVHELQTAARARREALVREHPDLVETDAQGWPVLRGEIVALAPSAEALDRARAAGFRVSADTALDALDLRVVVIAPPAGMSARTALQRLQALDPGGRYGLDHLFEATAAAQTSTTGRAPADAPSPGAPAGRVGMVDTGVALRHPALARAAIRQEVFAPGAATPRPHGTGVASLIVGDDQRFKGAAPGATLYAADVFGAGPVGGSSLSISHALAWMAKNRVPVINISLAGPDDLLLRAAVSALVARGYLIVAPAGNEGPAAPAAYPASYPGVVSVAGLDAGGRLLPECGRPSHIDFAAPAADMIAAGLTGYATVRGTSFAAALVAGELARRSSDPGPAAAKTAQASLAASGRRFRPPLFSGLKSFAMVAEALRIQPPATPETVPREK